jgi:hypothetical protein
VSLALPGAALVERSALPLSGVLFVLLTLSAVSFDGLSSTFWWLGLGGINPLEFPGRTDVMGRNTVGLLMTVMVLGAGFGAAIRLGWFGWLASAVPWPRGSAPSSTRSCRSPSPSTFPTIFRCC